jgi:hypothetical protein
VPNLENRKALAHVEEKMIIIYQNRKHEDSSSKLIVKNLLDSIRPYPQNARAFAQHTLGVILPARCIRAATPRKQEARSI